MKSKTFKREKRMKIRNNNKYDNSSFPSHHSEQRYSLPRERIFPKKKKKKKQEKLTSPFPLFSTKNDRDIQIRINEI